MAQTTILAAAATAATSSSFTVAAGAFVTVGIFSANGQQDRLPATAQFSVLQSTPGGSNVVTNLNNDKRSVVLIGPGTFTVARTAYTGTSFGAFTDA